MNLFYQPSINLNNPLLDEAESNHVVKVLRHQPGDKLAVTDGAGNIFHCSLESIQGKTCALKILQTEKRPRPSHHIHIALAPTKSSDRTEWFVEKATEIGIQEITFLNTRHSERPHIKLDRMVKTAIGAIKQSGQAWLPVFHDVTNFEDILNQSIGQKFIAHVDATGQSKHLFQLAEKKTSYLVLIGPEGDFSDSELLTARQKGFTPISLGNNTLRTETAALTACHILNLLNI